MNTQQATILQDLRAYVDRCAFEQKFEQCLVTLMQDCNTVLLDGEGSPRLTAGEFGKIFMGKVTLK